MHSNFASPKQHFVYNVLLLTFSLFNCTCCHRRDQPQLPPQPKPIVPINIEDIPASIDETMKFFAPDVLQPARVKIAELHEAPAAVQQHFSEYIQWLTIVSEAIRTDGNVGDDIIQRSRAAYDEFSSFSGIHYQCDVNAGCHDLIGAAIEVDSTKPENLANPLITNLHGQSETIRNAAAKYLLEHFTVLP